MLKKKKIEFMIYFIIRIISIKTYEEILKFIKNLYYTWRDFKTYAIIFICDFLIIRINQFKELYTDEVLFEQNALPFNFVFHSNMSFSVYINEFSASVDEALSLTRLKLERFFPNSEAACQFIIFVKFETKDGKLHRHSYRQRRFFRRNQLIDWIVEVRFHIDHTLSFYRETKCLSVEIRGDLSYPEKRLIQILYEPIVDPILYIIGPFIECRSGIDYGPFYKRTFLSRSHKLDK